MKDKKINDTTNEIIRKLQSGESLDSLLAIDLTIDSPGSQLDYCCKGAAKRFAYDHLMRINEPKDDDSIWYRRITRGRLQAMHVLSNSTIALVYESTSLFEPRWLLRRIKVCDDDDEEYYWKDWYHSLSQAEDDYIQSDQRDVSLDDILTLKEQLRLSMDSSASTSTTTSSEENGRHYYNIQPIYSLKGNGASNVYIYDQPDTISNDDDDDYWNRYDNEI